MKKILLALLSLTLLLTACSKDENAPQPNKFDSTSMRFYGVKLPELPSQQGAAQHDRLWHNGTTIKVRFLNGSEVLKERVRTVAKEWEEYANITFKFVESGDAHVRVGFDWNDNRYITWSYIGTDCKTVLDQGEATLSFAYFEYIIDTDPETVRADILRAFGQVLGLELESRNINFSPKWTPNPALVPNYWSFNISDVMWAQLKKYVFDPLDAENAVSTEAYDAKSIMKWPFPSNILLNGGGASMNFELSETDKEFIAQLYPKPEDDAIIVIKRVANAIFTDMRVGFGGSGKIIIDWGDGTKETIQLDHNQIEERLHTFANGDKEYTIKVYGSNDAITLVNLMIPLCSELDVTKNTMLEQLHIMGDKLNSLNLTNNTQLKNLLISHSSLTEIDLTKNTLLREFSSSTASFNSLNLSNCSLLESLSINNSPLTDLDLSQNINLKWVNCTSNQHLSTFSVPNASKLVDLTINNNNLMELNLLGCSSLTKLICHDNILNSLILPEDNSDNMNNPNSIEEILCMNNQLASLYLARCGNLRFLDCSNNSLIFLDGMGADGLTTLRCSNNQITSMHIAHNFKIVTLECSSNNLSDLFFYENPLKYIGIKDNPIESDYTAMLNLANSLPINNTSEYAYVKTNAHEWIDSICFSKGWIATYNF